MIGGNAPLPVSGASQRNLCRVARNEVGCLDHITDGIDIGVARLEMTVNTNSSASACLQACVDRQFAFGANSNSDNHELRR
jgi:hypothetical protein